MSAYQYEPLSAPDSIRLLLLEPFASRDDILRGSLLNTTLWECDYDLIDSYTALSYVWGSGEKPCQIFLDGRALAITRSLRDALLHVRDATRVRRVWADAICIDQLNIPERNSQVALMGRIYSEAANTVIYLGDLTVDVSGIFAAASRQPHYAAPVTAEDASGGVTVPAVRDLVSRPWFKRVWIFQELVLSRDPWVQCGRTRSRWTDICRLLLVNARPQTCLSEFDKSNFQLLEDMNNAFNRKQGYTLAEALTARRGLGATDPRDFVYANLGVANDGNMSVNYEETSLWIYVQAAKYMVDKLGIGKVMSYVDDIAAEERLQGLPSWAPDWRLPSSDLAPLPHREYSGLELDCQTHHVFIDRDGSFVMGHIGYMVDAVKITSGIMRTVDKTHCIHPSYERAWDALYTGNYHAYECDSVPSVLEAMWGSWIQWFQDLEDRKKPGSPLDGGFAAFLKPYLSTLLDKFNRHQSLDIIERDVMGLIHHHFRRPGAESLLTGRRLAITGTGKSCVVPSQTRYGDVVGYLTGSVTEVIFRPVQTPRRSQVTDDVARAFRETGRGFLGHFRVNESPFVFKWRIPRNDPVNVVHYRVIGEGLLNRAHCWRIRHRRPRDAYDVFSKGDAWALNTICQTSFDGLQVFVLH